MTDQDTMQALAVIRLLQKHADHTMSYIELLLNLIEEMQETLKLQDHD